MAEQRAGFAHPILLALAVVLGTLCAPAQSSLLSDQLVRLRFLNSGTTSASAVFAWRAQQCLYLEPANVSRVNHAWAALHTCHLLYQQSSQAPGAAHTAGATPAPPPLGVRNSVPLGGIAAGSVELRGDGSFREWTIMNQSPGGAAKIPLFADMFVAVKLAGAGLPGRGVAKALRTHPPPHVPGVSQLTYSGAYPVSRLVASGRDFAGLHPTLFAWSTFKVDDMVQSSRPAISFALQLHNPTPHTVNVSILLSVPLPVERDTARPSTHPLKNIPNASPEECMAMCIATTECASWCVANATCALAADLPLNRYQLGAASGVRGSWATTTVGDTTCLTWNAPGVMGEQSPTTGNVSLCGPDGATSFASASDGAALFDAFANTPKYMTRVDANAPIAGGMVYFSVPAGSTAAQSLSLGWFFPHRDEVGTVVGNAYANHWDNASHVAADMQQQQEQVLDDVLAFHEPFLGVNSSLPELLGDSAVNSMAHIRSAMWYRDGRWRQWEAYDCNDVDSVHNDGERHIPYISFFPDSTINKVLAWAKTQGANGMIAE